MTDITFQGGSGQLYHSAVSICLKMDRTAPALEPESEHSSWSPYSVGRFYRRIPERIGKFDC
jgi:hypothetical protein